MVALSVPEGVISPKKRDKADLSRSLRRISMLKRMGVLSAEPFPGTVERALSVRDLHAAYRLVHDSYVAAHYIEPQPDGLRLRVFEALDHCATFVAKAGDKVVGVLALVRDTPEFRLPSDNAFNQELQSLRDEGQALCEMTSLAVRPEYRSTNICCELMRPCFAQGYAWGCDSGFLAISPSHVPFFRDVLQLELIGEQRSYSCDLDDPVVGMIVDAHEIEERYRLVDEMLGDEAFLHDKFFANNPCRDKVQSWAAAAAPRFRDPGFLRTLLCAPHTDAPRFHIHEYNALRTHWGDALFGEVFDPSGTHRLRQPSVARARQARRTTVADNLQFELETQSIFQRVAAVG